MSGRWRSHKRGTTNDPHLVPQHPSDPAADSAADRWSRHVVLGTPVAAIGIGMVDFDQRLVGALDLLGRAAARQTKGFEGATVHFEQVALALGDGAARLGAGIAGKDVQRVRIALLAFRPVEGGARLGAGAAMLVDAHAPGRTLAGGGGLGHLGENVAFVHAVKEIEGAVIMLHMLLAEQVKRPSARRDRIAGVSS